MPAMHARRNGTVYCTQVTLTYTTVNLILTKYRTYSMSTAYTCKFLDHTEVISGKLSDLQRKKQ